MFVDKDAVGTARSDALVTVRVVRQRDEEPPFFRALALGSVRHLVAALLLAQAHALVRERITKDARDGSSPSDVDRAWEERDDTNEELKGKREEQRRCSGRRRR